MKFILPLVLLSSLSFAQESPNANKYDYQKCQFNTNKLFQIGSNPDRQLPRIFNIDKRTNTLTPNEDHTVISNLNSETGEYTFQKTSKEKIGMFRKKTDPQGTQYNFKITKDKDERITSITYFENDSDYSKTINFEFSDKDCVPSEVYEQYGGKTQILADISTCRSMSERYKKLFDKVKDANKCMQELGDLHQYLMTTSEELINLNKKYKLRGVENASYSKEVMDMLEAINESSKTLMKTVRDKKQEYVTEGKLSLKFFELNNHCFSQFTDKILYSDDEFKRDDKGVYHIKDKEKLLSSSNEESSGEVKVE